MSSLCDYKKYAVLYVDDEEKSLEYLVEGLGDEFRILTAKNAEEGYNILVENQDEIGILLTDQRMPGGLGTELLEKTRNLNPRILRILATAYSDFEAAIEAVNTGAIYKYIAKPWKVPELQMTLMRGLEFFMLQKERDQLLREKLSSMQRIIIADRMKSLGLSTMEMRHRVNNALAAVKTFVNSAPDKKVMEEFECIEDLLSDLWEVADSPDLPEVVREVFGNERKDKR